MSMSHLASCLAVVLAACGSQSPDPATPSPEPIVDAPVETTPIETPVVTEEAVDAPPTVEQLLAQVEAATPSPWPALADATDRCPPPHGRGEDARSEWFESCDLPGMAAWDAAGARWIVLDVDRSEGGIEHVSAIAATATADQTLLTGELTPQLVTRLRTLLRRQHASASANLVTGYARRDFSIVAYAALVTLGAPLEGTHLWIETSTDLDAPEHVLWRGDGSTRAIVARRPAELGPCDGDGWSCDEGETETCTPEQLRAENRLCVLPVGIDGVAMEGGTLAVLGTVAAAGHGGEPPFHWVVPFAP